MTRTLLHTTAIAALLAAGTSLALAQGTTGGSGSTAATGAASGSQAGTQAGAGQSSTGQSSTGQSSAGQSTGQTGTGSQMGQSGSATDSPADGTKAQAPGQAAGSQPATVGGAMSDEQVRTQLSAQGYSDIQSIMRDGNDFHVRATQNGRPMDLRVDAYTGTVRSSTAAR